jgi:N6-adenosine-specific RNA methylase IME4
MFKNAKKRFVVLVCSFCCLFVNPNAAVAQSSFDSLSIEELEALYNYQLSQANAVIYSCYQSAQIWGANCETFEQQWGIYFAQFANYIDQRRAIRQ